MPKLHFLSACTGFVIAGLLALTTSQASPPPATLNPASIRVEYMPHPRDMVQIKEGVPYTVPAGKLFVLTALGATNSLSMASIHVDGQIADWVLPSGAYGAIQARPSGMTVGAGSTITVDDGDAAQTGRAWGYLASQ